MQSIYSPRTVKDLLEKHGLHSKKSLGQNFLVDQNIIEKIANAQDLENNLVIEIGPGLGALTVALAKKAKEVIALELDKQIIPALKEVISSFNNITIINGDAVKEDFDLLAKNNADPNLVKEGYKVAANLPYYVTTPIIMHLLEKNYNIKSMVFMMQKEVAERIMAKPGGKDYGSLSVAVQFFANPVLVTKVPASVFFPRPNVESAVIKLEKYEKQPVDVLSKELFFKTVKAAFGKRRKTLLNALSGSNLNIDRNLIREACMDAGIDPGVRAENLSIQQFASLSNKLKGYMVS